MIDFNSEVQVELYLRDLNGAWDEQPVTIAWNIEIDYRSWGVKDIDVFVPDQEVDLIFTIDDENGDPIEQERTIPLKNILVSYDGRQGTPITPQQLIIRDDEVEVVF